ncbi:MAG: type II toxin-antitoxin system VapC family toxin [Acidimicrobiales bacterium]
MTFGTLVDSNVLLDILTNDQTWSEWSLEALAQTADRGPLYINPVIYAEVSIRFSTVEAIEDALPSRDYRREPLPWAAAFLAGKAFVDYRRNQGTKSSTLPDFFIGAHAAVAELSLLTRDTSRYRTYFPTVELITP